MNAATEQIFEAALALADGDRVELVEALVVSQQPADRPPFDESWREVIRRRSLELRSGQAKAIPWEEMKRKARHDPAGQVAQPQ